MLVLGITGGMDLVYESRYDYPVGMAHDAAAALIDDGKVVAAIEEERLNRIKHTNKAPVRAIRSCLESYGVGFDDIDRLAVYGNEQAQTNFFRQQLLSNPEERSLASPRPIIQQMVEREFGHRLDARKISFVHHHLAHAMSAFALSGFDRSLVMSIDGEGDDSSGMVLTGEEQRLKLLSNLPVSKSLGLFYLRVIQFVGYTLFDEYKVMGLAPHGDPSRYRQIFKSFYSLLPDGDYALHEDRLGLLFNVVTPRRKGEPFTAEHQDLAAALQETLETIVFHVLTHYRNETGHQKLCLAGGVAQNCTLNGKILYSGMFEEVFVQPAAHDAGCALGAALFTFHKEQPQARPSTLEHVYLGTMVGGDRPIPETLSRWSGFLHFEKSAEIAERAAQLLAEGSIIGWVQGRSEFGPRALGNRSILADPRPAENMDIINAMVKKREAYRPFAPSVMEGYAQDYFQLPNGSSKFPYMIFVLKVAEDKREILKAVTHVDGTARIQTVSRETNERFWSLLDEFRRLTGIPVLLNTSFNNNAEPIVDTVNDAVVCFLTTGLHHLVVGDYLVSRKAIGPAAYLGLAPSLPPYARLRQTTMFVSPRETATVYEISRNYEEAHGSRVSPTLFALLGRAGGGKTLGDLLDEAGVVDDAVKRAVADEACELWAKRLIELNPRELAVR